MFSWNIPSKYLKGDGFYGVLFFFSNILYRANQVQKRHHLSRGPELLMTGRIWSIRGRSLRNIFCLIPNREKSMAHKLNMKISSIMTTKWHNIQHHCRWKSQKKKEKTSLSVTNHLFKSFLMERRLIKENSWKQNSCKQAQTLFKDMVLESQSKFISTSKKDY